jgi:protein tyrosine/serine phosphatase
MKKSTIIETAVWVVLFGSLAVAFYALRGFLFDNNLQEVVPGKVYRSAQMAPPQLRDAIRRLKIKTVINLRGESEKYWYADEKKICDEEGVRIIGLRFSSTSYPDTSVINNLINALRDEGNEPILLHCKWGADRSGLGASFAVVVHGGSPEEARGQMAAAYGNFGVGLGQKARAVLELYLDWLKENGLPPSGESLSRWRTESYRQFYNQLQDK